MSASEHPTPPERELAALLPCPFCGGEAHLERQGHVACKTGWPCGHTAYMNSGTPDEQNAAAITAWNTRAAALPQGVSALARSKADRKWGEWSAVLRRMIGDRTHKLHFAADVQADEDGVRFDNCRFIYAKPDGYIHMGQYIERCHADDRHAGWQPVWTSRLPPPPAELGKGS